MIGIHLRRRIKNKILKNPERREIMRQFRELPFPDCDLHLQQCPICFEMSNELDYLPCKHFFCHSCMKLLLLDFIGNARILPSDLKCPICESLFNKNVFKELIGSSHFERLRTMEKNIMRDLAVCKGDGIYCPIPGCEGYIFRINGVLATACAVCKISICSECLKVSHPNMSCEEYKEECVGEREVEDLLLAKEWKRCPYCASIVEKNDGCQFIRCHSNVCKGNPNRCLCYLCGKGLEEKHHHSHYKTSGPFSDSCNSLEGIEDDPFNEEAT